MRIEYFCLKKSWLEPVDLVVEETFQRKIFRLKLEKLEKLEIS